MGIPYPSVVDPKVRAKKSYNDWKAKAKGWNREDPLRHRGRGGDRQWSEIVRAARDAVGGIGDGEGRAAGVAGASEAEADAVAGAGRATLSGDMWYKQQAFRALNQVRWFLLPAQGGGDIRRALARRLVVCLRARLGCRRVGLGATWLGSFLDPSPVPPPFPPPRP